jgi:hypothetical protein
MLMSELREAVSEEEVPDLNLFLSVYDQEYRWLTKGIESVDASAVELDRSP